MLKEVFLDKDHQLFTLLTEKHLRGIIFENNGKGGFVCDPNNWTMFNKYNGEPCGYLIINVWGSKNTG